MYFTSLCSDKYYTYVYIAELVLLCLLSEIVRQKMKNQNIDRNIGGLVCSNIVGLY